MKRKILTLCMLMALAISTVCCSSKTIENNPTDEELAAAKTICGVVREVEEDSLRIQLCGNQFQGTKGEGYIDVTGDYSSMEKGDSVLVYYTGHLKYEDKDGYTEVGSVEIIYVDHYDNDGEFEATMGIVDFCDENGEPYPVGDPRDGVWYSITPQDNEPEAQFAVSYIFADEDRIEVNLSDSWDVSVPITVKYNTDTMEVISITQ